MSTALLDHSIECLRIIEQVKVMDILTDNIVHPCGLVQYLSVLYLISRVEGEKEPHPFRLHRVYQAGATTSRAVRPKGFDIDPLPVPGPEEAQG